MWPMPAENSASCRGADSTPLSMEGCLKEGPREFRLCDDFFWEPQVELERASDAIRTRGLLLTTIMMRPLLGL
jgi:hypothetical protein